jgi:hypothetical protein
MTDEPKQDSPSPPRAPVSPAPKPELSPAGIHHKPPHYPKFKFLEQLRRRNVGRVGLLYIAVAYVGLEVFELFFIYLRCPLGPGAASSYLWCSDFRSH